MDIALAKGGGGGGGKGGGGGRGGGRGSASGRAGGYYYGGYHYYYSGPVVVGGYHHHYDNYSGLQQPIVTFPGYYARITPGYNLKSLSITEPNFEKEAIKHKYATVVLNNITLNSVDKNTTFHQQYTKTIAPILNKNIETEIIMDISSYFDVYSEEQSILLRERLATLQALYTGASFMFNLDTMPEGDRLSAVEQINPQSVYSLSISGGLNQEQENKIRHILNATMRNGQFPGYFNLRITDNTADDIIKTFTALKEKMGEIYDKLDEDPKKNLTKEQFITEISQKIGFTLTSTQLNLQGEEFQKIKDHIANNNIGVAFIDPLIESPFHKMEISQTDYIEEQRREQKMRRVFTDPTAEF